MQGKPDLRETGKGREAKGGAYPSSNLPPPVGLREPGSRLNLLRGSLLTSLVRPSRPEGRAAPRRGDLLSPPRGLPWSVDRRKLETEKEKL